MEASLVVAIAGLGMAELMVILAIVVLIFGASKLPMLGKGLGEGIRNFKSGVRDDSDRDKLSESSDKTREG